MYNLSISNSICRNVAERYSQTRAKEDIQGGSLKQYHMISQTENNKKMTELQVWDRRGLACFLFLYKNTMFIILLQLKKKKKRS